MGMIIDLPIDQFGKFTPKAIYSAEIVDVAEHLAMVASFAVIRFNDGTFRVVNIETGMYVKSDAMTKAKAISNARKYLADKTPDDLERAYTEWKFLK